MHTLIEEHPDADTVVINADGTVQANVATDNVYKHKANAKRTIDLDSFVPGPSSVTDDAQNSKIVVICDDSSVVKRRRKDDVVVAGSSLPSSHGDLLSRGRESERDFGVCL